MNKSITLNPNEVSCKSNSHVKTFLKNISPFNNKRDVPTVLFVIKKLLAFALCYWVGLFIAEGLVIGCLFACGKNFLQGEMFSDDVMVLIALCGMTVLIAVSLLYWRLIEKRGLSEMGVTKNFTGWFVGGGIGVLLIIVSVSAIMITGTIKPYCFSTTLNIRMLLLMLGGYAIQSAAEEFLCRGLVFGALKDKVSLPVALGASTLVFILPHMGTLTGARPWFTLSGVINLIVISCVLSFITLRTQSIWAACGLHSLWNFVLECVCGLTVSGSEGASTSVINMHSVGENLLNGGKYGIEASIITALVTGAAAVLLWHSYKKDIKERQA